MSKPRLLLRALAAFFSISLITPVIAQTNELPPPQLCDEGRVAAILEEKEGFLERVCDDNQITFTELEKEKSGYIELLTSLSKRMSKENKAEADKFENSIRSIKESIILFNKAMEAF